MVECSDELLPITTFSLYKTYSVSTTYSMVLVYSMCFPCVLCIFHVSYMFWQCIVMSSPYAMCFVYFWWQRVVMSSINRLIMVMYTCLIMSCLHVYLVYCVTAFMYSPCIVCFTIFFMYCMLPYCILYVLHDCQVFSYVFLSLGARNGSSKLRVCLLSSVWYDLIVL